MSKPVVLDNIPFQIDRDCLLRELRIQDQAGYSKRAAELARQAEAIARPRGLYRVAYVESRQPDSVVIEGVTLTSRVLRVNLDDAHRVFPFVTTCGRELYEWSGSIDDMLERFWADAVMELALRAAVDVLKEHLATHIRPGPTSSMNPGSLGDWPIEEQRALFKILGNVRDLIGVELTDHFLLVPTKSVSGLSFPTRVRFENCQLCPRERCPGRRAPYDPGLYERRYARGKEQAPTIPKGPRGARPPD